MGREIRRVPKGWEHPKDESGFIPLLDGDYELDAAEWLLNCEKWENGTHEYLKENPIAKETVSHLWEYDGPPPEKEQYRPHFDNADCYQIYETVSDGTPVSPVFETLDQLAQWLVSQGYSEKAAQNFAKAGWAPSMVMSPKGIFMDIESCGIERED